MNTKPRQTEGTELAKVCSRVVKILYSNIQTEKVKRENPSTSGRNITAGRGGPMILFQMISIYRLFYTSVKLYFY